MIVSFTGHRKIFGQYFPHKVWNPVCEEIIRVLKEVKPELILSGMALGADSVACEAANALGIPYKAIIPFAGQENAWPLKSRVRYQKYLASAKEVVIVSGGGYSAWKMETRNHYLVDNCNLLIGCYDGSSGGTANCLEYARQKQKQIILINPKLLVNRQ